ncbi:MAG: N-acetylmuramoyl-L-alanine amidase-like domain-containing protein, partial [Planctomycetota bacterium]
YLTALQKAQPNLTERIVALGRQNIGQPYDIYLLGEFPFELHDPDPIYCLSKSDCVTFCEHTYAMALGSDWWSFLRILQRLRYRDGVIGMLTRNHYTIADWDRNNSFLFEDQTAKLGGGRAAVSLNQICRRARFFARFGIGQDVPDEPLIDAYIPKERVRAILGELRDADFINIIRGDANSQWAGHTGMIALGQDGTPNLLHSARPAVREQPLLEYLATDRRCLGIKVLRLRPDAEQIMRRVLSSSPRATAVTEASLGAALRRLWEAAPPTASPQSVDWSQAMRLQSFRLEHDTPVDLRLQNALEQIDRTLGERLGIPQSDRALGVLDLTDLRLAVVGPDEMFYAASVPKVCILLAYFATNPETAISLSPEVERELGRMIKISDNALAAKYGQLVGMEKVQELLQSRRYRFYDEKRGGGLWYGKHYTKASPRIGDPLRDHSHGATVRQGLRFYLMLEQGRLVSAAASTKMKEIFAAPHLEHIGSKFVAGLQGRDLSLIRKSGTWEDWHLDTARVERGERVYLLTGMTHHPRGGEYLAAAAAAIDDHLCGSHTDKPYVHQLVIHDALEDFRGGTLHRDRVQADPPAVILSCSPPVDGGDGPAIAMYESPVIETDTLFNEVLISWNVDAPPNVALSVDARVGRRRDGSWSPYLHFADWGEKPPPGEKTTECDRGRIDVDYFVSEERFDSVQYRLQAVCSGLPDGGGAAANLRVARVAVCLSDTTGRLTSVPRRSHFARPPVEQWQRRLPVPFRSQRAERKELAGRICSPASVAMVLEYRGVNRPTEELARRIYDAAHDIYGNWPRAVQASYSYGVPGYLARFSDWTAVEQMIAHDQPLIISIRADEGELSGAPYKATEGHLLVITGFEADGRVSVNDPAVRAPAQAQRTYSRRDLETVWMRTRRGTAYVLRPPENREQAAAADHPAEERLVDVSLIDPRILIDLRYATADNFTGQQLYPVARCLLRE